MFRTDIESVKKRGLWILGSSSAFLLLLVGSIVIVGDKTNAFERIFIKPIEKKIDSIIKESKKSRGDDLNGPANSYSEVNIEIRDESDEKSNVSEQKEGGKQDQQNNKKYYAEPTVVPAQPSVNNNSSDFQKEWNERKVWIDQKNLEVQQNQEKTQKEMEDMNKSFNEMKNKVENSQKKFCDENPSLCD